MTGPMSRALRKALGFGLGLWLTALAAPSSAQDAQSQAAEALYRQAKSLMAQEKYAEACEKFSASQSLEPGLGTLLYLGDCYERAGRFASALATFQEAQEFAKGRNEPEREHLASVRAAALEPRVPRLELRLGAEELPDDLQITLNGTPVERRDLNRPLPYDADTYEVHFSAPGYQTFTTKVELRNGEARSAVVKVPRLKPLGVGLGREAAQPSRAGRDAGSGRGDTQRTVGWIVGAAGLAMSIGSGVFTYLAASRNSDSKSNCDSSAPNRCNQRGVSARQDAQDLALAATVAGIAGGVGLAGGLVLHLSAPSTDERGMPDSALLTLSVPLL